MEWISNIIVVAIKLISNKMGAGSPSHFSPGPSSGFKNKSADFVYFWESKTNLCIHAKESHYGCETHRGTGGTCSFLVKKKDYSIFF